MKKVNLLFWLMLLGLIPVLQSCDDDEGYSLGNYMIRMATVERESNDGAPYFSWDNGKHVWVAASAVPFTKLKTGQRVVANFTLLSDRGDFFAHDVRLNDYRTVLTKEIIDLTEANQDSIGNSGAHITDLWLSGDYLNVEFWIVQPTHEKHMVNLVRDLRDPSAELQDAEGDDGYLHLGFRYNDMGDMHGHAIRQMVSFKLNIYNQLTASVKPKGIKLKINSAVNGERIITLNHPMYNDTDSQVFTKSATSEEVN